MRNLRKAQAVLRLAEKYGPAAMEAAAERALAFGNLQYRSLKTILEKGWLRPDASPQPSLPLSPLGQRFLRPPEYFGRERRWRHESRSPSPKPTQNPAPRRNPGNPGS